MANDRWDYKTTEENLRNTVKLLNELLKGTQKDNKASLWWIKVKNCSEELEETLKELKEGGL